MRFLFFPIFYQLYQVGAAPSGGDVLLRRTTYADFTICTDKVVVAQAE